jgi:hypothetical protein
MSLIPLKDTVTVEKTGGRDDWGRPTGVTTKNYACRIDNRIEIVKNQDGQDVVSKAEILIDGVANVTVNDVVKWSDPYGTYEAKPISVSPLKDLSSKVLFTRVVV